MKKRIAMIVNSNIYSGLETVTIEIMENLKTFYDFIYVTKDGPIIKILNEKKLKYYIISKMSILEIRKFISTWHPDIIHAQDYTASVFSVMTLTKIPIISHLHNNALWIRNFNLKTLFYTLASFRIKKILTVSNSIENEFIFSSLFRKKIKCIGNPVNVETIKSKIKNYDKFNKEYDICCVGRITEAKDPYRFIQIIGKVKEIIPNVKAIWIGNGELLNDCKKLCSEMKLDGNLNFVGYKNQPYDLMIKSKVFLLTGKWEGFGLAAIEALTTGLPCIVSNVGGLKDIVDINCGKLCNTDNDFVEEICRLLQDYKYFEQKSINAMNRANKFDNYGSYMLEMRQLYEKIGDNV